MYEFEMITTINSILNIALWILILYELMELRLCKDNSNEQIRLIQLKMKEEELDKVKTENEILKKYFYEEGGVE